MKSNVRIIGKTGHPKYIAELEYFDFYERNKVIERTWPETPEQVQQFRENLSTLDFNKDAELDGRKLFTAIRIYKGDKIIYDRYCKMSDTEALKILATKITKFKQ